jgi:hypothetical protein
MKWGAEAANPIQTKVGIRPDFNWKTKTAVIKD